MLKPNSIQVFCTCTRYSLDRSGRRTCSIRWAKCSCRTSLSWLTHAITASKTYRVKKSSSNETPAGKKQWICPQQHTFSSVGMVSLSLAIRLDTCSMPRLRNSSLPTTSGKCCSGNWWNQWQSQIKIHSIKPLLFCLGQWYTHTYTNTHRQTCVAVRLREELRAGVQVCEGSYSETVGRMKLRAQEFTASFFHLVQLEQACCRQQRLSSTHTHKYTQCNIKMKISSWWGQIWYQTNCNSSFRLRQKSFGNEAKFLSHTQKPFVYIRVTLTRSLIQFPPLLQIKSSNEWPLFLGWCSLFVSQNWQ